MVDFSISGSINDVNGVIDDLSDHVAEEGLTFEFDGIVYTADSSFLVDGERRGRKEVKMRIILYC